MTEHKIDNFVEGCGKIEKPESRIIAFHNYLKRHGLSIVGLQLILADAMGLASAFADPKGVNVERAVAGSLGVLGNIMNFCFGSKKEEGQEYAGDKIPLYNKLPDSIRPDKNPIGVSTKLFIPGAALYAASFTNAADFLQKKAAELQVTNVPGFVMGTLLFSAIMIMAFMPEGMIKGKKQPVEAQPPGAEDLVIDNPTSKAVGVGGKLLSAFKIAGKGIMDGATWLLDRPMQIASLLLKPVSILTIAAGAKQENIPLMVMGGLFFTADLTRFFYVNKTDFKAKPVGNAVQRIEESRADTPNVRG